MLELRTCWNCGRERENTRGKRFHHLHSYTCSLHHTTLATSEHMRCAAATGQRDIANCNQVTCWYPLLTATSGPTDEHYETEASTRGHVHLSQRPRSHARVLVRSDSLSNTLTRLIPLSCVKPVCRKLPLLPKFRSLQQRLPSTGRSTEADPARPRQRWAIQVRPRPLPRVA